MPCYQFAYDSSPHTLYVGATHPVLAIDTGTDVIEAVILEGKSESKGGETKEAPHLFRGKSLNPDHANATPAR